MRMFALLAAAVLSLTPAQAQQYPDRVIKLVVPFVPGSPVDVLARVSVAADDDTARPERRGREPARRRHLDRDQAGAVVAARRLHAADDGPEPGLCRPALSRHRLRSGEGVRAGRHAGRLVACDAGRQQRAGEVGARSWSPTPRPIPARSPSATGSAPRRRSSASRSSSPPGSISSTCPTRAANRCASICSAGGSPSISRR